MNAIVGFLRAFGGAFIWWTIIQPWEEAIRVRLGSKTVKLQPGVRLCVPFGYHKVYRQNKRLRTIDLPVQTLTTLDGKTLTTSGMVFYRIVDIERLYSTLHHAQDVVRNKAMTLVANYVNSHDKADVTPAAVQQYARERLVESLRQYGLNDVDLSVTDFCYVRTYRFITDSMRLGTYGDGLSTDSADRISHLPPSPAY